MEKRERERENFVKEELNMLTKKINSNDFERRSPLQIDRRFPIHAGSSIKLSSKMSRL